MTETIEIGLEEIDLAEAYMPRDLIHWDVVNEYKINIDELPPILVAIGTGAKPYILIDGWHRYYAHEQTDRKTITAIFDKNLESKDFLFRAICANKAHGIRFTAEEKKRISKYLFIRENRSAAEISQAIGCSVRHATDLIKDLADEKKETAVRLAKRMSKQGISQRDIAADLKRRGFKTSKSSVDRWLKPEVEVPQIGESPKRDRVDIVRVNRAGQSVDEEGNILNVSGEVATVAPYLTVEQTKEAAKTRSAICPKCEIRTFRVPILRHGIMSVCTKLYCYCDKCKEYIPLYTLQEKAK